MKSKLSFFNIEKEKKALPYKMIHDLVLREFKNRLSKQEKLELIKNSPIEIVAALANYDEDFAFLCYCEDLKGHWGSLWCAYGLLLTRQKNLPEMLFFAHPNLNQFDLVLGAYFYHLSQEIRKNFPHDFSYSERRFLSLALEYGSVHAMQRHNEFLYEQLNKSENNAQRERLYAELVENCKILTSSTGSYGYMALAEALGHYCIWELKNLEFEKAQKANESILESLEYAQAILTESMYSIKNASLGGGLKCSNSYGKDSPEEAKTFFMGLYQAECAVSPLRAIAAMPS